MNEMEVTQELKSDIESNQTQLKTAIYNHQNCLAGLELDPFNIKLQKDLNKTEEDIVTIGLDQKNLLDRLRDEYKAYQKSLKTNGLKERRFNSNALNRDTKQNIVVQSTSATSFSDDSIEHTSPGSSPEHIPLNPVEPQDVTQLEFLHYFSLATREAYKEMQNKRAKRKRRSTANSQYLYGNKSWDFLTNNKRKRNSFLISPVSPPNSRQKKQERISPLLANTAVQMALPKSPVEIEQNGKGSVTETKATLSSVPIIPNFPSGLIIERVSSSDSLSLDNKTRVTCKQPEKLDHKRQLEEKKLFLSAESMQLQDRHSQLTVSLKDQKNQQNQFLMTH